MRLESPILDAGREATPEAIEEVVRRLPESDDPFVIVSVDSLTYIQAVWAESGFLVEHQEGDLSRHYLSERDDLSVFELIDLLKAYARKDQDWARGVAFEHMVLPEPTPRQGFLARIFSRLFGRSH
ncbi:hypothetical protein [Alloalcanivorax xenomutans]|jgi:hypothetical protein|uniref:Uncharacterized protein n=1 Tax=Alloalcanivorax xenomutans TaxID=1094342 RepID=A0A9Q3W4G1_9GAMM|nr:hypothetical protein [Alloalcanivorax xenomutans]ARB45061.1 hypothetical protein P40_06185 [Alloalcanivorax xenomutans]ERS13601.1 hypothetical protein Q668_13830 [Alcanivorax sp. PN-3]MCE7509066.1 hypothetical protein [Alloalcanivorax xenomutans]